MLIAVGRRIGPAASKVHPHRKLCPNLIFCNMILLLRRSPWQAKLNTQVRITRFLLAIEERRSIREAAAVFGSQGMTEGQLERLKGIAEEAEFGKGTIPQARSAAL